MRTIGRVMLTFAVSQAVAGAAAWACSCAGGSGSPEDRLAEHDVVFVGVVKSGPTSEFLGGCGGGVSSADPVFYQVEVTEAFKGVAEGDILQVETARDGASCGVDMAVGESRLVYTDEDLHVGLCDPGGPVDEGDPEVESLREATAR